MGFGVVVRAGETNRFVSDGATESFKVTNCEISAAKFIAADRKISGKTIQAHELRSLSQHGQCSGTMFVYWLENIVGCCKRRRI